MQYSSSSTGTLPAGLLLVVFCSCMFSTINIILILLSCLTPSAVAPWTKGASSRWGWVSRSSASRGLFFSPDVFEYFVQRLPRSMPSLCVVPICLVATPLFPLSLGDRDRERMYDRLTFCVDPTKSNSIKLDLRQPNRFDSKVLSVCFCYIFGLFWFRLSMLCWFYVFPCYFSDTFHSSLR